MQHIVSFAAVMVANIQDGVQRFEPLTMSSTKVMALVMVFTCWAVCFSLRRSYTRDRS